MGEIILKNRKMANKGKGFEETIVSTNEQYKDMGLALIQEISTPWVVIRKGKSIVSAFPKGKSTLDFRGTVNPGIPISFDCKETKDERGLPLANIQPHQIDYIRNALSVGETSFILCHMTEIDSYYFVDGSTIINYWDRWQENKGKRGYNFIPSERMNKICDDNNIGLHYLEPLGVHLS